MADWAEGKDSSLLTPQGNPTSTQQLPPASPVGTGSSWRGEFAPVLSLPGLPSAHPLSALSAIITQG